MDIGAFLDLEEQPWNRNFRLPRLNFTPKHNVEVGDNPHPSSSSSCTTPQTTSKDLVQTGKESRLWSSLFMVMDGNGELPYEVTDELGEDDENEDEDDVSTRFFQVQGIRKM